MRIAGRVVTPEGVIESGVVSVEGPLIADVSPAGPDDVHSGHWLVPGFVDIHVHGGGGHTFTTGDAGSARLAAAFHLSRGTTTMLASLVSSPFDLMLAATKAFAPLVDEGVLAGIHFEGPYLSQLRCGAQNPEYLRDPSTVELEELVETGAGAVRMMTVAPERPGALAAIGHTDASYEQTLAGVAAGGTVATHLFNGMRPVHHREPGPVLALLRSPTVVCELIADGVHLHDGTLSFAASVAGTARAALVTDAMAAAGMGDGEYDLGSLAVNVSGGVARLASDGAIAGSTLTMDAALRRAVGAGLSIVDASRMASGTPAAAIGLASSVGALRPGLRADLVELTEDLQVVRVMRGGAWL